MVASPYQVPEVMGLHLEFWIVQVWLQLVLDIKCYVKTLQSCFMDILWKPVDIFVNR